jgi:uncharacterized repeat protein (TIGR04138 family)
MEMNEFSMAVRQAMEWNDAYPAEAFYLVRDALDTTCQAIREKEGKHRHVRGPELLDGFRRHVLQEFGPAGHLVLGEWNLRETGDVGEIVFLLIRAGIFNKTKKDAKEDFDNVYSFEEAFVEPFLPRSRPAPARETPPVFPPRETDPAETRTPGESLS